MTNITRSVFVLLACVCIAQAIPVTQCGTTLNVPGGQYELVGNLNCAFAPGVQIGANSMTLDLKGFTIFGPGTGAGSITASSPSCMGVTDVMIVNGSVAGFNTGIALCAPSVAGGTSMHNRVSNVKLCRNVDGIRLYNSNNNIRQESDIFDNRGVGVRLSNSHDNQFVSNAVSKNVSANFSGGIHVYQSNRNTFQLNRLMRNGRFGLYIQNSDKNNLYANSVMETNVAGTAATWIIIIGPHSQANYLRGNTAEYNQNGISLGGSGGCALVSPEVGGVLDSMVPGTANNNRVFGIDLSGNTANNTVRYNKGAGNGVFDGHDDQGLPPCGSSIWQNNTFVTVNQACVQ